MPKAVIGLRTQWSSVIRRCPTLAHTFSTVTTDSQDTGPSHAPKSSPLNVGKSSDLSLLEIRVGKIVEIAKHPEADSLYVEKVDVGEQNGPRTIVSGLVQFCSIESLQDRRVVVLCNLKPRALKGITSHGMLLCASNPDHTAVEPLTPASETTIGELITFEGHPSAPAEPGNKASKAFSKIADDFFVDDNMTATFKGIPFMTSQGIIRSNLKGKIS